MNGSSPHRHAGSAERSRSFSHEGVTPRVCLVVPASDPRKVHKAITSSADEVVLDLEDSVAVATKDSARREVGQAISPSPPVALAVRINQVGSPWCHLDLLEIVAAAVVARPARPITIVVPKVESGADVVFVDRLVRGALAASGESSTTADFFRIDVLVESARALRRLGEILASTELLRAVVIGYADLSADLGRGSGHDPSLWDGVRHHVVTAARAAGVQLIDGPWLGTAVDEDFLADRGRARALGFDGAWVIHPSQVEAARQIFSPTDAEIAWAQRVVSAIGSAVASGAGAVALDGQMLDEAVAVRARRVLALAQGPL